MLDKLASIAFALAYLCRNIKVKDIDPPVYAYSVGQVVNITQLNLRGVVQQVSTSDGVPMYHVQSVQRLSDGRIWVTRSTHFAHELALEL